MSRPDSVLFTEQHSCEVDSCGNIIVVSCELQRQLDRYCYQFEVDSCGNIIVVSCELQRQLDRYCYQFEVDSCGILLLFLVNYSGS